jgi:hypothetical protein
MFKFCAFLPFRGIYKWRLHGLARAATIKLNKNVSYIFFENTSLNNVFNI